MESNVFKYLLGIVYLVLFFLFGSFFTVRVKKEKFSFIQATVVGFFLYFTIFEIVAIPEKLFLRPLDELSKLWLGIVCVVSVLSIILNGKTWIKNIFRWKVSENIWVYAAIITIILAQLVLITNNIRVGSDFDASYYIGQVNANVYTNTIDQYNSYNGQLRPFLNQEYFLITYQAHSSVFCQLTKLHPLLEQKFVMSSVVIVMMNLIYCKMAEVVFNGMSWKVVVSQWFAVLLMAFGYSIYTQGGFYFYRCFEGKTILAVIIIPALFWAFSRIVRRKSQAADWILLLFIELASLCFSMSMILIVPVFMMTAVLPHAMIERNKRIFIRYVLIMIPCLIGVVLYYLSSKSILQVLT